MLFCNVPFVSDSQRSQNLADIFHVLNRKKEQGLIETYALTQTTLEQIFVQLAGEDEDAAEEHDERSDRGANRSALPFV